MVTAAGQHPRALQRGAVGAIASGVVLFLAGTVVTPLAGADSAITRHSAAAPSPQTHVVLALPSPTVAPAAPKVSQRNPTQVAKRAPVGHGFISALAGNGIPHVALNAYRVAAARMASADPGCGIPWYLLAGIGRVESDHGRFGGAVLHSDGVSTPAIIGPALDGKHYDFIPAPANGLALDGDAKYAHALGPMQFIPSTWAGYGTDANGDGKADIFNINDAALGAGRYLCAAGGNLRDRAGQTRAVLAYNHSAQYVAQVLALADAYHRGVPISGIPTGITKGKLPKVAHTGYIPPANPGAPTAVAPKKPVKKPTPTPTPTKSGGKTSTSGTKSSSKPKSSSSSSTHTNHPTSGTTSHSSGTAPSSSPKSSTSTKPALPVCTAAQVLANQAGKTCRVT